MTHTLTRVLGALFVFGVLALSAATQPRTADALSNCEVDSSVDSEEQAFLGLINAYRAKSGARALVIDPALTRAASWMANDLAGRSSFGHSDSLGRTPWTRMPDCGVGLPGGENLAAGTNYAGAQTAMNAWINSPSHRDTMLYGDFTSIGIARVYKEGSYYGWYWVTDFGYGGKQPEPAATTAPPPPPPPPPAAARPAAPAPAAPAAPAAATPAPEPRLLGVPAGLSLVAWEGGYVSPADVFGGRDEIEMVYVFDLGSETWLRWGTALNPELRSLTEMRTGVQYWVISSAESWVPMP